MCLIQSGKVPKIRTATARKTIFTCEQQLQLVPKPFTLIILITCPEDFRSTTIV